MKEPSITKAPSPTPIGWGWQLMATRADTLGIADYAQHCRDMAARSIEAGRNLLEGEDVKPKPKGQLTLW